MFRAQYSGTTASIFQFAANIFIKNKFPHSNCVLTALPYKRNKTSEERGIRIIFKNILAYSNEPSNNTNQKVTSRHVDQHNKVINGQQMIRSYMRFMKMLNNKSQFVEAEKISFKNFLITDIPKEAFVEDINTLDSVKNKELNKKWLLYLQKHIDALEIVNEVKALGVPPELLNQDTEESDVFTEAFFEYAPPEMVSLYYWVFRIILRKTSQLGISFAIEVGSEIHYTLYNPFDQGVNNLMDDVQNYPDLFVPISRHELKSSNVFKGQDQEQIRPYMYYPGRMPLSGYEGLFKVPDAPNIQNLNKAVSVSSNIKKAPKQSK